MSPRKTKPGRAAYMRDYRARQRRAKERARPGRGHIYSQRSNTGFRCVHFHIRTNEVHAIFGNERKKVSVDEHGIEHALYLAVKWRLERVRMFYHVHHNDICDALDVVAREGRRLHRWLAAADASPSWSETDES